MAAQQPVHRLAHIVFFGFAHHASHGFAILIEDKSAGHDVAQAETVQRIRVGVHPAIEVNVQFRQRVRDLRVVLRCVYRDEDEADRLACVRSSDLRQTRQLLLARPAPRSPEVHHHNLSVQCGELSRLAIQRFECGIRNMLGHQRSMAATAKANRRPLRLVAFRKPEHRPLTIASEPAIELHPKVECALVTMADVFVQCSAANVDRDSSHRFFPALWYVPEESFEVSSVFPDLEKTKMKNLLLRSAAVSRRAVCLPLLLAAMLHTRRVASLPTLLSPSFPVSIPPMNRTIAHSAGTNFLHGLTVSAGYRVYNSYKHYIGTVYQVQRQTNHNAVVNHVNLFELDLNYQFTPQTERDCHNTRAGRIAPRAVQP